MAARPGKTLLRQPVRPFLSPMSPSSKPPAPPFTPAERAWLRQELGVHFGAPPHIADGIFLRSWKSGPEKGRPKLPPESLVESISGAGRRCASMRIDQVGGKKRREDRGCPQVLDDGKALADLAAGKAADRQNGDRGHNVGRNLAVFNFKKRNN